MEDFGSDQKNLYICILIHAIVYAPFMVGYGLYNNNFLISLSVMDRDIFFHKYLINYYC